MSKSLRSLVVREPNEGEVTERDYAFAIRAENVVNGIPFMDPLCNVNGIAVIWLVPDGTPPEVLRDASHKIHNIRDVVYQRALRYNPPAYFPAVDQARERRMAIANEIWSQLGGNRFAVMTGAKCTVAHDLGLSFQLPRKKHYTRDGINHVKITLTPMDVYDIEWGKISGYDYHVIATDEGVYCDQLLALFRDRTGLATNL